MVKVMKASGIAGQESLPERETMRSVSAVTYMSGVRFARQKGFPIRVLTHFSKYEYPALAYTEEELLEKIREILEFCPQATIRLFTKFDRRFWHRKHMPSRMIFSSSP